jgi:pyruvate dehydrogenase E1 component beta subunit
MSVLAEEAMKQLVEEEVQIDLILPLMLHKLDLECIVQSLRHSGRLVIVEEGTEGAGFAERLIAQLHEKVPFTHRIVCSPAGLVPAASNLEVEFLPSQRKVFVACCEVFDE